MSRCTPIIKAGAKDQINSTGYDRLMVCLPGYLPVDFRIPTGARWIAWRPEQQGGVNGLRLIADGVDADWYQLFSAPPKLPPTQETVFEHDGVTIRCIGVDVVD